MEKRIELTSLFKAVLFIILLFQLSLLQLTFAQRSEPSKIVAFETDEQIRIDGRLDEQSWSRAQCISNFTQRELDYGEPATERTEVAILFDTDALYVGFWGYDKEPRGIRANEMARDFSWSSEDNFEFVIDPFDDNRTGYLFVTNPNGARSDALISDGGRSMNRDWDGVWDVRARITEEGWFAEIRIPFSTLRFRANASNNWGINFERNIRRKREQLLWQGWSRDHDLETLSQAGSLSGLHNLSGVKLIEAKPFGIAGAEWREDHTREGVSHAGVDLSYLPTPNWKINVTVRPDFAQVESDREEVNLTRFSLFYPEKRHFFLEGSEFFDFELGSDVRPFYSRRIGLAENRSEVPIDGGLRVLGKQGGTTLGAMVLHTAATGAVDANNFGVVRLTQDVLDESSLGLLAVARRGGGTTNATYGFDAHYATSELFGDKEFAASISLAQSITSNRADRYGSAYRFSLSYPNDLVAFSASWSRADDAFDPQVGFIRRTNYDRFASELAILPRPRFLPLVQQFEFKPFEFSWYRDVTTHEMQSVYIEFVPLAFELRSGDSFEFNLQRRADNPELPFELFDDAEIPAGSYWFTRWSLDAASFGARRISGAIEISGGEFYLGTRTEYMLSGRWRANRYVTFGADWEHNRIELFGDTFLVDELAARIDFAFNPKLFGAVAGQWNSEDEEFILNFRLNWIPQPGSDVFLVINQIADSEETSWNPQKTTVLSKIVWRFAL